MGMVFKLLQNFTVNTVPSKDDASASLYSVPCNSRMVIFLVLIAGFGLLQKNENTWIICFRARTHLFNIHK